MVVTVVRMLLLLQYCYNDYNDCARLRSLQGYERGHAIQGRHDRGQQSLARGRSPPRLRPEAGPSVEFIHCLGR